MTTCPDIDEIAIRMSNLWNILSEEEQGQFAASLTVRKYKKNMCVYQEGDSPDYLLCLLSGKVKIFRNGVGGRSQIMRIMRPVQYFGYRASLASEPYVTTAIAFEEAFVCAIPMAVVRNAMSHNIALCQFFIRELATDLGIADSRIVGLTQKHIRGRLAESLLFLKDTYGLERDGKTIDIHLSREDLAGLSNMTTSNAIRTLSNFSSEGIVSLEGRSIRIIDEEKLKLISRIG